MTERLFDGRDLYVIAKRGNRTDSLLITFSHAQNTDIPSRPFAMNFADAGRASVICFVSKRNHWWQTEEISYAAQCAREWMADSYSERIGYGISMGAYGVLLHGSKVGLTRAVVISPQTRITGDEVPLLAHWRRDIGATQIIDDNISEAVRAIPSVVFVFDNLNLGDRWHAKQILHRANIISLVMPFCGHQLLQFLKEISCLEIAEQLVFGEITGSAFRATVRRHRLDSIFYLTCLSKALRRRRTTALSRTINERLLLKIEELFLTTSADTPRAARISALRDAAIIDRKRIAADLAAE